MKTFKQYLSEAKGRYDIVLGKHTSEMTPNQKREYRNRQRRNLYHEFKSKYNPWKSSSAVARDKSRS